MYIIKNEEDGSYIEDNQDFSWTYDKNKAKTWKTRKKCVNKIEEMGLEYISKPLIEVKDEKTKC